MSETSLWGLLTVVSVYLTGLTAGMFLYNPSIGLGVFHLCSLLPSIWIVRNLSRAILKLEWKDQ